MQALFRMKPGTQNTVSDTERIQELFGKVVKRAIEEQGWQPILDVIKEMPCDEDFEPGIPMYARTFCGNGIIRAQEGADGFSEALMEDEEDGSIFYIPDATQNVEAYVIAKDFVERFLPTSPKRTGRSLSFGKTGIRMWRLRTSWGTRITAGLLRE